MLDTRKVHMMIKKGCTSAQIMEEFSIATEEDFERELRQAYTSKSSYGKVTRMLDQNDKQRKKKTKTNDTTSESPEDSEEIAAVEDSDNTEGPALQIEPENPETLDEVLSKIDETQANLNSWERKFQTSQSNRNQIRSRLDGKKNQLLKLLENVRQIEKEVETFRVEYEAEEAHMKEYNKQISGFKVELEKLNSKRETLETLFILVYANSIEINSESITDQIPENWIEIYDRVRNDERLDFLRVVEQKTLSKFLALKTVLPKNRKQELCFDSSEMEAAYDLIKDQF